MHGEGQRVRRAVADARGAPAVSLALAVVDAGGASHRAVLGLVRSDVWLHGRATGVDRCHGQLVEGHLTADAGDHHLVNARAEINPVGLGRPVPWAATVER